ncbi:unnamed protein product, partial [Amoebophrya sp. A25]|eukprot:GSA25T00015438001.1
MGGIEELREEIRDLVLYPLQYPSLFKHVGAEPPTGVLLHGPPGSGKSMLAQAIAGTLKLGDIPTFCIAAPEIVSGVSGESENKLRSLFQEVKSRAPALLFFDEIDAILPKRDHSDRQMDRRIVAQFSHCLDELRRESVLVLAATNRPESIDAALRRAGRFDREIAMGIPNLASREKMLSIITREMRLANEVSLRELARNTPGYVAADLVALTQEAALTDQQDDASDIEDNKAESDDCKDQLSSNKDSRKVTFESRNDFNLPPTAADDSSDSSDDNVEMTSAGVQDKEQSEVEIKAKTSISKTHENMEDVEEEQASSSSIKNPTTTTVASVSSAWMRGFGISEEELAQVWISSRDFSAALKKVQPSSLREGFATAPDVSWEDVGGLITLREELELAIIEPIRKADLFASLGLNTPAGVLLYGPPGCGKTLVAKAVAAAANANFISVKGPELLNKYVGESERAVRSVFQRARTSSPCIIFFDELDSMVPKRSSEGNSSQERVVNQMLTEMDGMNTRRDVFVIAATNRPDIIDAAMLRPGRLDKLLYVPLPDEAGRKDILESLTRKSPLNRGIS